MQFLLHRLIERALIEDVKTAVKPLKQKCNFLDGSLVHRYLRKDKGGKTKKSSHKNK